MKKIICATLCLALTSTTILVPQPSFARLTDNEREEFTGKNALSTPPVPQQNWGLRDWVDWSKENPFTTFTFACGSFGILGIVKEVVEALWTRKTPGESSLLATPKKNQADIPSTPSDQVINPAPTANDPHSLLPSSRILPFSGGGSDSLRAPVSALILPSLPGDQQEGWRALTGMMEPGVDPSLAAENDPPAVVTSQHEDTATQHTEASSSPVLRGALLQLSPETRENLEKGETQNLISAAGNQNSDKEDAADEQDSNAGDSEAASHSDSDESADPDAAAATSTSPSPATDEPAPQQQTPGGIRGWISGLVSSVSGNRGQNATQAPPAALPADPYPFRSFEENDPRRFRFLALLEAQHNAQTLAERIRALIEAAQDTPPPEDLRDAALGIAAQAHQDLAKTYTVIAAHPKKDDHPYSLELRAKAENQMAQAARHVQAGDLNAAAQAYHAASEAYFSSLTVTNHPTETRVELFSASAEAACLEAETFLKLAHASRDVSAAMAHKAAAAKAYALAAQRYISGANYYAGVEKETSSATSMLSNVMYERAIEAYLGQASSLPEEDFAGKATAYRSAAGIASDDLEDAPKATEFRQRAVALLEADCAQRLEETNRLTAREAQAVAYGNMGDTQNTIGKLHTLITKNFLTAGDVRQARASLEASAMSYLFAEEYFARAADLELQCFRDHVDDWQRDTHKRHYNTNAESCFKASTQAVGMLLQLSDLSQLQGNHEETADFHKKVIETYLRTAQRRWPDFNLEIIAQQALHYHNLGEFYHEHSYPVTLAANAYTQAAEILREKILIFGGRVSAYYEQAIDYRKKALKASLITPDKEIFWKASTALGKTVNKYAKYLRKEERESQRVNAEQIARLYEGAAQVFVSVNEMERAREFFLNAGTQYAQLARTQATFANWTKAATAYDKAGDESQAHEARTQAHASALRLAQSYFAEAEQYVTSDNPMTALRSYQAALTNFEYAAAGASEQAGYAKRVIEALTQERAGAFQDAADAYLRLARESEARDDLARTASFFSMASTAYIKAENMGAAGNMLDALISLHSRHAEEAKSAARWQAVAQAQRKAQAALLKRADLYKSQNNLSALEATYQTLQDSYTARAEAWREVMKQSGKSVAILYNLADVFKESAAAHLQSSETLNGKAEVVEDARRAAVAALRQAAGTYVDIAEMSQPTRSFDHTKSWEKAGKAEEQAIAIYSQIRHLAEAASVQEIEEIGRLEIDAYKRALSHYEKDRLTNREELATQYVGAVTEIAESAREEEKPDFFNELGHAHVTLAHILAHSGEDMYEAAAQAYAQAADAYDKAGNEEAQAVARGWQLSYEGYILSQGEDTLQAIARYTQAIESFAKANNTENVIQAYSSLANLYEVQADKLSDSDVHGAAAEAYIQAAEAFTQAGNTAHVPTMYENAGNAYMAHGNALTSADQHEAAAEAYEAAAEAYMKVENMDDSAQAYKAAADAYGNTGNTLAQQIALGSMYFREGDNGQVNSDYLAAAQAYTQAAAVFAALGEAYQQSVQNAHIAAGNAYMEHAKSFNAEFSNATPDAIDHAADAYENAYHAYTNGGNRDAATTAEEGMNALGYVFQASEGEEDADPTSKNEAGTTSQNEEPSSGDLAAS